MVKTNELTRGRGRQEDKGGVELATEAYEPEEHVRALLAANGVSMVPPSERVGSHEVHWEGKNFVLPASPEPLGLRESAEVLQKKADEEEQPLSISEIIDALPWDGAQAFALAVKDLFGWGIWQPQKMMWMKIPPTLRTIRTGPNPNDTMQVIWGEMFIPQLEAKVSTAVAVHEGRYVFQIRGEIQKKNRHRIDTLVALARIYATERSIYKGKAIRLFVNERGQINNDKEPEFIKVDRSITEDLVFSDDVRAQLNTNLFAPIMYPQACRKLGIPLKRGILLAGPYGVGKSMTAAATAAMCTEFGWTFIMLDRVAGLKQVLDFAHRYAPVVVFAEDIDRIISGDDRTVSIDDVLNTLDGVQGKAHEIITVLTTNHPDRINHAMLRPGRLDAIVSVKAPDAVAAEKLMRQYGRGLIDPDTTLAKAGESLAGHIPAVIREAVERAKLTAVYRTEGRPTSITDEDLVVAADTMKNHLDLMAGPGAPQKNAAERLGDALGEILGDRLANYDQVDSLDDTANGIDDKVTKILQAVT